MNFVPRQVRPVSWKCFVMGHPWDDQYVQYGGPPICHACGVDIYEDYHDRTVTLDLLDRWLRLKYRLLDRWRRAQDVAYKALFHRERCPWCGKFHQNHDDCIPF